MIPNPDTYCEIDPVVVDKWGIPVLRFHFAWSDYELKMAKDMQETFAPSSKRRWNVVGGGKRDPSPQNAGPAERTAVWHLRRGRDHSRTWNSAHGRRS